MHSDQGTIVPKALWINIWATIVVLSWFVMDYTQFLKLLSNFTFQPWELRRLSYGASGTNNIFNISLTSAWLIHLFLFSGAQTRIRRSVWAPNRLFRGYKCINHAEKTAMAARLRSNSSPSARDAWSVPPSLSARCSPRGAPLRLNKKVVSFTGRELFDFTTPFHGP